MGFNRPANANTDRTVSIANNAYSYFNFVDSANVDASMKYARELSASLHSDAIVTFWFEWGRTGDDPTALPYSSDHSTCAANDSRGLIVPVCGAPQRCRLVIYNTSGGTATVTRDVAVWG